MQLRNTKIILSNTSGQKQILTTEEFQKEFANELQAALDLFKSNVRQEFVNKYPFKELQHLYKNKISDFALEQDFVHELVFYFNRVPNAKWFIVRIL